jgi:tetratricopeptide (TPR) repeat protein
MQQGKLEEAVACFRRALELDRNLAQAHNNLGNALKQQGKLDDAIACFRQAVRLAPTFAEAHCNLGYALRNQGRFRDALAALEEGHRLGSRSPGWRHPSAAWVRECRRLVELEDRLPAVLAGTDQPADEAGRLEFIRVSGLTRRFAAAARLYAEAFAARPQLAADLRAGHRYNAACLAARAGCGQGADATGLTAADRLRWRRQALTWLRDDLAAWAAMVDRGSQSRPVVQRTLQHWQQDPDLVGLRDKDALARLPQAEREACRRLWADVAALLRRVSGSQ